MPTREQDFITVFELLSRLGLPGLLRLLADACQHKSDLLAICWQPESKKTAWYAARAGYFRRAAKAIEKLDM